MIKDDIIFYIGFLNYIGGVETWVYEIAKKFGTNRNITLIYSKAAPKQLLRLRKLIRCVRYDGQQIECDKFVFCYDFTALATTKAKEYIYTIHADYKAQNIHAVIPPETTQIYAVSQLARDSFEELHRDQLNKLKLDIKVLYNPITVGKPKRVLTLISPTRLSKEKGGARMVAMAKRLKEKDIPFIWFVYSVDASNFDTSNFIMMDPELDIRNYIANADYLVQLSDTEGYAYSLVEAMCLGTPAIVTELPILEEMRIKDGENCYILKFNLSNMDKVIDKMYNTNIKNFKYIKNHSDSVYEKILGPETEKQYNCKEEGYEVKVVKESYFAQENVNAVPGDIIVVETKERLQFLQKQGYVERI